ncbi:hypothetical protein JJL45_09080 [Tamlana sp. s12]|uniref:hypothetical protein n=1 Tax=Tamlana sp. s12 TaxID=1630406 RepID=UPI0007FEC339|nr:hypothetical protein [Tamlana sp. s12]OBQ52891.1 hypothetical protein VQ01_13160 [Tamlana sp. s12]QQY81082.1 hypothetical protein JJL45_09080 [Tamlana sp. s12]
MAITAITTNAETANALENHIKREQRSGLSRSFNLKSITREENYVVVYLEPSHDHKEIDPTDIFFLGFYTCLNT